MKKFTLVILAAGLAVTAACGSTPDAETTATTVATTATTATDKRPGSPQVYADIAAETDCTELQASFDRAEATSKRDGGPEGTTWSKIGIAYMKAADDRMQAVNCY